MFVTSQVPASEVSIGDFTTFSGFRRVYTVEAETYTTGRGKKRRAVITGYRFGRFDGTVEKVAPDAWVTVRRLQSDGPT